MKIISRPKINLCLDVIKKERSGYHKIQTIFYELDEPFDEIEITASRQNDNVTILQGRKKLPIPLEKNLAYLAIQELKKRYKIDKNVDVKIQKRIPLASGLGGASSNAAAVLVALNKRWKLDLTTAKLRSIGAKLGMDVPFFIEGGTALGTGYGEKIKILPDIKGLKIKLTNISSRTSNKTKAKYSQLDIRKCGNSLDKTEKMIRAIKKGDLPEIIANTHNDFETITPQKPGQHLCGAGPSMFSAST